MKRPFLQFDFPHLAPHRALQLLAEDLKNDALYIVDGHSVGVRDIELLQIYIQLGREAVVGLAREYMDQVRAHDAATEAAATADPAQKSPAPASSHAPSARRDAKLMRSP